MLNQYQQALSLTPDKLINQTLFLFMDKLIFNLLVNISDDKYIISMTKLYIRMLQFIQLHVDKENSFILWLLLKKTLSTDRIKILEALISHSNKDVRDIIAVLLPHLCFENYDFSRQIATRVLTSLNKVNSEDENGLLGVIANLMTLDDSLM